MEKKRSKMKSKPEDVETSSNPISVPNDQDNLTIEADEAIPTPKAEKKRNNRDKSAIPVDDVENTEPSEDLTSLPKAKKSKKSKETTPDDSISNTEVSTFPQVQKTSKKDKNEKVDISKVKKKRSPEAYQRRRKMAKEKAKSKRAKKV